MKDYIVVPLGDIIDKKYNNEKIENAFKNFSCQREKDLETFLKHKAVTYQRIDFGKTYLCVDKARLDNDEFVIMAFFTIAQRAINIGNMSLSKRKKILGEYPGRDDLQTVSAFLIGQLGRSDDYSSDDLSGEQLLKECYSAISKAAKIVGGKLLILECREHMYEKFYEKHGFKKLYNELNEEELYTLYKKIDFSEYWKMN